MTDERSSEIYSRLSSILKREGLDWIVESVEAQIREGEVKETEVKVPSKILPGKLEEYRQEATRGQEFLFSEHKSNIEKDFINRYGSNARLLTAQHYTPQEALKILISAIENTVLNLPEIENQLIDFSTTFEMEDSVDFEPDEFEGNPEPNGFLIKGNDTDESRNRLRELLIRLKRMVTDGN